MKDAVDRFVVGLLTLTVLVGFFIGCQKEAEFPPEPPVIVIVVDGGGVPYTEPYDIQGGYVVPECAAACTNLRKLGCADGYRRPGEDTCYAVCKRAQQSGVMDFKPGCVAEQTSIAGVRSCGTYRCLD